MFPNSSHVAFNLVVPIDLWMQVDVINLPKRLIASQSLPARHRTRISFGRHQWVHQKAFLCCRCWCHTELWWISQIWPSTCRFSIESSSGLRKSNVVSKVLLKLQIITTHKGFLPLNKRTASYITAGISWSIRIRKKYKKYLETMIAYGYQKTFFSGGMSTRTFLQRSPNCQKLMQFDGETVELKNVAAFGLEDFSNVAPMIVLTVKSTGTMWTVTSPCHKKWLRPAHIDATAPLIP